MAWQIVFLVGLCTLTSSEGFLSANLRLRNSKYLTPRKECRSSCANCLLMSTVSVRVPQSLGEMMRGAGRAVAEAVKSNISLAIVDVPLPITGGTELDDWPGGIGQKYMTLQPMAAELMKTINFTSDSIIAQNFLGVVDDAIGVWEHDGISVICFATPEVLNTLHSLRKKQRTVVLLNHQFFLDTFSSAEAKNFLESSTIVYQLQSLNMKGSGLLPIRGVLVREFPLPFVVARKLEDGNYVEIGRFDSKPTRNVLDELFLRDSESRDSHLSWWDRVKRIGENAKNI